MLSLSITFYKRYSCPSRGPFTKFCASLCTLPSQGYYKLWSYHSIIGRHLPQAVPIVLGSDAPKKMNERAVTELMLQQRLPTPELVDVTDLSVPDLHLLLRINPRRDPADAHAAMCGRGIQQIHLRIDLRFTLPQKVHSASYGSCNPHKLTLENIQARDAKKLREICVTTYCLSPTQSVHYMPYTSTEAHSCWPALQCTNLTN